MIIIIRNTLGIRKDSTFFHITTNTNILVRKKEDLLCASLVDYKPTDIRIIASFWIENDSKSFWYQLKVCLEPGRLRIPLVSSSGKKRKLFSSHLSSSFYQMKVQESRGKFVCAETQN
jgi:hypothetical protein